MAGPVIQNNLVLSGHTHAVTSMCLLDNGLLASGSDDKTLRIWDLASGTCLKVLRLHTWSATSVCALSNGRLACGSNDNTRVRIWEVATGTCVSVLEGHTGGVNSVCVLNNGLLASGSQDKTVRVWTLERTWFSQCVRVLHGHIRNVLSVCALDYGLLASGSGDHTVRIWDVSSGWCLRVLRGHTDNVISVAALSNGRLASASDDKRLRIWDLDSGASRVLREATGDLTCMCAMSNGCLASGYADRTVRIWDVTSGTCLHVLKGHTGGITSLCDLGNGRLASGSNDYLSNGYWSQGHFMSTTTFFRDYTVRVWNNHIQQPEVIAAKEKFKRYIKIFNLFGDTDPVSNEIYRLFHDIINVPGYLPDGKLTGYLYDYIKQCSANIDHVFESGILKFPKTTLEDICLFRCCLGVPLGNWPVRLLTLPMLFIDYFGPNGENFLMALISAIHIHTDIRLPIIMALLTKQININAVDTQGRTALHYALNLNKSDPEKTGVCDDIIVEELLAHPLLCPTIKDNTGQSALDIAEKKWSDEILSTRLGQIDVHEIKWKGLTRAWVEDFVNFYYNSSEGFVDPHNNIWCLSCLGKGVRPSACDHVSEHNCKDLYATKVKIYSVQGGIPPGYNGDLLMDGNLHCCAQCCETLIARTYSYCRYGCRGVDFQCPCPKHRAANAYKYYKLYKMIEKFAEFQDPKFFTRNFSAVWTEVTNYAANSIPFSSEICVDFRTKVEATNIFIPEHILEKFPNILETEIYPSGVKGIPVPNMRRMDDVIKNDLIPTIIEGPEKENNINLGSYTKFINLVHRQNIKPDFPIKKHKDRAVEPLCIYIRETSLTGYIDCPNKHRQKTDQPYCGAYLFPDELGVLVSSGDLDHDSYIAYRNKFMYNEILDFDSAAYPYFIGQTIKKPEVLPVRSLCEGGGAKGGRHTVKRRTAQRHTVKRRTAQRHTVKQAI